MPPNIHVKKQLNKYKCIIYSNLYFLFEIFAMALLKGKYTEVPPDAVVLSKQEALQYQAKILSNWKSSTDVFFVKYGGGILGSVSAAVGIYINGYFRKKFKLRSQGKLSSYLPICVIPAFASFMLHTELVLPSVMLQDECAVCVQMRSAALQSTLGFGLPALLAPLSATALATQYGTYNVPYVTKEPLKVLQLWRSKISPIGNLLFAIFLGQALLGSAIVYLEGNSVLTVNEKLAKLEYDLEHSDLRP